MEDEDEGFTQGAAINRATVEQGDVMIAQDATRNFLLEQLVGEVRGGSPVQITDGMLAAAGRIEVVHRFGDPMRVEVRGDAVNLETAAIIGDRAGDRFAAAIGADRALGEQLRKMQLGFTACRREAPVNRASDPQKALALELVLLANRLGLRGLATVAHGTAFLLRKRVEGLAGNETAKALFRAEAGLWPKSFLDTIAANSDADVLPDDIAALRNIAAAEDITRSD